MRQSLPGHVDDAEQVHIELLTKLGVGELLDRSDMAISRVVEHHVDLAEPGDRIVDGVTGGVGVADVELQRHRLIGELVDQGRDGIAVAGSSSETITMLEHRFAEALPKPLDAPVTNHTRRLSQSCQS